MRLMALFVVVLLWPVDGNAQEGKQKFVHLISSWYGVVNTSRLDGRLGCTAVLLNDSGERLYVDDGLPILIAELPVKNLFFDSQYRYDKQPVETEIQMFGSNRVVIPSRLESAKSLLVAFDVEDEGYHYATFDLTDGQKVLDWFNSPDCTGE